mgnify:CR=1 FL=1
MTTSEFLNLHPAVQCTIVVMGTLFLLGVILAWYSDFWNNISNRKK